MCSRGPCSTTRARRNLPLIGQRLNDFDIAGVQECFTHCDLLLGAATHPTRFYFDEREHWWSLANSGLASVARFGLLDTQTTYFSADAEIGDSVASKGVLLLSLALGGHVLDIYSTHMQAGESEGAQEARRVQADELVAFVQAHSPAGHSVMVHGDFNMSPARPGRGQCCDFHAE
jgi:endonuclease/exonuclease/phosphatase family metal-dependent hydrolase